MHLLALINVRYLAGKQFNLNWWIENQRLSFNMKLHSEKNSVFSVEKKNYKYHKIPLAILIFTTNITVVIIDIIKQISTRFVCISNYRMSEVILLVKS